MARLWYLCRTSLVHQWYIVVYCGICVVYLWYICGMSVAYLLYAGGIVVDLSEECLLYVCGILVVSRCMSVLFM